MINISAYKTRAPGTLLLRTFLGTLFGALDSSLLDFWVTFLQFSCDGVHRFLLIFHGLHLFLLFPLQKLLSGFWSSPRLPHRRRVHISLCHLLRLLFCLLSLRNLLRFLVSVLFLTLFVPVLC